MNKPNIYNVTKIERLSTGIIKVYNQSNVIAIFSSLKSISIYRENGNPTALMFCQDCVDPFAFTVYNLTEIIGSTTTQTFNIVDVTDSNSLYVSKVYSVLAFLSDECLIGFPPQPTFIGGVVVEYPNFASFPVTGQSGVIYIDMSVPEAYVWDGAAYQSLSGGGGFVPYTGATADVDLGAYNLKADAIELSQTPTDTAGVAKMVWNDSDGTIEYKLKGGNVTLQVGQEEVVRVVNKSGGDLLEANYQVVRIRLVSEGGASGQRLAVVLAQGDSDTNSATTIGLVTETILNNQEGYITTFGLVREIDTTGALQGETWVDGDIIYLSPTTAGAITNVKPVAPQHMIILGYVVYAHAVHGKIFVKVDNGYELDELHNVKIVGTPADGEVLTYKTSLGNVWTNDNITTSMLPTGIPATNIGSGNVDNTEFDYLNGVTSGIQSQLNAKEPTITAGTTLQYLRGDKTWATLPIQNFQNVTDGTAVTGTTLGTLTKSILIPANTVGVGDVLYIKSRARKTGTAGTLTVRMYINTSAAIGGSLIATSATNAASTVYFQYNRTAVVKTTTNTETMAGNGNINADDNVSFSSAVSTNNIDWTVDQYLVIAHTNSSAADSSVNSFGHIQINKA
jgi:hypothetical protein